MERDQQHIPNVLASRYASAPVVALWSPEQKVVLERRLWIAILRAQRELGVDVPDGVLEAYEAVVDQVIAISQRHGIAANRVGRCEAADKNQVDLTTPLGTFHFD